MTTKIFGQLNPEFTITMAEALGQSVYDLIYQIWGVRNPAEPPSNLQWPDDHTPCDPIALAGIAIGPSSDVDRVWVTYNRQRWNALSFTELFVAGFLLRRVSLDAPITYQMPTQVVDPQTGKQPITPSTSTLNALPESAMVAGQLYVFPMYANSGNPIAYGSGLYQDTTVLPTQFHNGFDGTLTTFGFAANVDGSYAVFYPPRLHLLLFLKPPVIAPTKRAPLLISSVPLNGPPITVTGASPTCIAQIPIFGRERIRIVVRSTQGVSEKGALFTAGVIRNICEDPAAVFEVLHATQKADDPASTGGTPQFMTITDPCGDYLTLWAQPQTPTDTVTVEYTVTAYDGPGTMQGC